MKKGLLVAALLATLPVVASAQEAPAEDTTASDIKITLSDNLCVLTSTYNEKNKVTVTSDRVWFSGEDGRHDTTVFWNGDVATNSDPALRAAVNDIMKRRAAEAREECAKARAKVAAPKNDAFKKE